MAEIHIAFAGNVGVGKTEFAQQVLREPNRSLLKSFLKNGTEIQSFKEIPERLYLNKFLVDPRKWAFPTQIKYLAQRLSIQKKISEFNGIAIEDRTMYEDRAVFVKSNFDMGNMDELEHKAYHAIFDHVSEEKYPDLLIYLKVNDVAILQKRLKHRGNEEDKELPLEYLKKLNENYDEFFDSYQGPKIAINAETDMFEHPSYHTTVVCEIAQKLTKLGFKQNTETKEGQEKLDNGIKFMY